MQRRRSTGIHKIKEIKIIPTSCRMANTCKNPMDYIRCETRVIFKLNRGEYKIVTDETRTKYA